MKLKAVILKNFRGYRNKTVIPVGDFTAFVGKNDIGKSTILEAVGTFLDEGGLKADASDFCVHASDHELRIGCVFTELPSDIILDATSSTSLAREYLLNADGDLEIHRIYDFSDGKLRERGMFALANHPSDPQKNDLLLLKNTDLKTRATSLDIDLRNGSIDARVNAAIRAAIWSSSEDLEFVPTEIALNKEDAKKIWEKLQPELPQFALFRSDRASTDEDDEVQDPMKLAIKQAIIEARTDLERVKTVVEGKALEVATRTLEKLQELSPDLAQKLTPKPKSEPKWEKAFELTLTSDNDIPLNKRGSGIRRLVLLSFFRAEAERRLTVASAKNIIYAIEEPEASQHPDNQRMLVEALKELSETPGVQVLITTHVPALASMLAVGSLRHVQRSVDGAVTIGTSTADTYAQVADDLGVLPDRRVRVVVCVEGPNDIRCLKHFSRILSEVDRTIPLLEKDKRICLLHLGGETLRDWVNENYLRNMGIPEVHIYDRGETLPSKFEEPFKQVNARTDGSRAFITSKREMENFLHPDAIQSTLGITITVDDDCDVPMSAAKAVHEMAPDSKPWADVSDAVKKEKEKKVKRRLNAEAVSAMNIEQLKARDSNNEVESWLKEIAKHL